MTLTDGELLSAAVAGDRDAMAELLRRCAGPLRLHVQTNLDVKWRALLDDDDVLQVTYMEAFDGIARFGESSPGAFVRWLTRLADNNIRDGVRHLSAAKRPNPSLRVTAEGEDENSLNLLESLGVHSTTPSRVAAAKEARQLLHHAMSSLPKDHQEIIRRLELAQEDPRSIATAMGRSVGAVYMLRARAHDRLRRILPTISV